MAEGQQLFAPDRARGSIGFTLRKGWIRSSAETHVLVRGQSYAQIMRAAMVTPAGAAAFVAAALAYMGLFLWLGGMLLYNSQLNYANIPKVNYDLTPGVGQPYLIFVPIPDILLYVNLTAAVSTLLLGGLFGLNAALFIYSRRLIRVVRKSNKGGAGLIFSALPTLVPYVGLGCCGTPAFPLLVGLLPSSVAGFTLRMGHYELVIGAIVALLAASTIYVLERIRRAGFCASAPASSHTS